MFDLVSSVIVCMQTADTADDNNMIEVKVHGFVLYAEAFLRWLLHVKSQFKS